MREIKVAKTAGFCFGVKRAVNLVYDQAAGKKKVYTYGPIIHNEEVIREMKNQGVTVIDSLEDLDRYERGTMIIRSHGISRAEHETIENAGFRIVDATCPVVLRLQRKIHKCYLETRSKGTQLVIYGKKGHAEVNGLVGQTEGTAIVVEKPEDLDRLDFQRGISLFSQTTKSLDGFRKIVSEIQQRIAPGVEFAYHDTICRQVANRLHNIKAFASQHDWVYFVAGKKSSNGKMLFDECLKANAHTVFISDASEVQDPLPAGVERVGICGATSTPKWLMEAVADRVRAINHPQPK